MPVRLLLGNHDDLAAFRAVFGDAETDPHGFVQTVLDTPLGRLIFVDTNEQGTHAVWALCGRCVLRQNADIHGFRSDMPQDAGCDRQRRTAHALVGPVNQHPRGRVRMLRQHEDLRSATAQQPLHLEGRILVRGDDGGAGEIRLLGTIETRHLRFR